MNVGVIRGFLLQHPKPHVVRITTGDGEPQILKPGRSYVRCAQSIAAIGFDLLEALDEKETLLRAMRRDEESTRSPAAPIPDGIKADPQALMLTHFANLVHRAYEHSTELAFTKMVELVEKMNDRSDAIEQRLERTEALNRRMVSDAAEDAIELARIQAEAKNAQEGDGTVLDKLAGAFLGGQMHANQGASNGKGHA